MSNVSFNDYLKIQLQDINFKEDFDNETTKLESAIALPTAKKEYGLSQKDLAVTSR